MEPSTMMSPYAGPESAWLLEVLSRSFWLHPHKAIYTPMTRVINFKIFMPGRYRMHVVFSIKFYMLYT
jgi:hypothetical protein